MKNENLHIEELIAKYLGGECSAAEEAELLVWTKEDIANKNYFDSLKNIYDKSSSLKSIQAVDTDAAWNKLKASIERKEQIGGGKIRSIRPNYFLRIAAVLLIVGGMIAVIYNLNSTGDNPVLMASGNTEKEVVLPDSTKVFLNKNSSIEYAYNSKGRSVKLTGEAFFEVVHESRPFVVTAGNLEVKDIGTAFNIDATSADVDVYVESGEVVLKTSTASLNLVKGERSVYKAESNTIEKLSLADPNALSYKTKIFVFENTSLPAVIEKLNEVYGTNILLSDNLKYCRLTSTFKNEKIESILQIIAETLQLRIVSQNSQTILEGNSCEE